jgi:hypothetical protein
VSTTSPPPAGPEGGATLAPAEHPARRLLVGVGVVLLFAAVLLVARDGERDARDQLLPYLGEKARVSFVTESGEIETLDGARLLGLPEIEGAPVIELELALRDPAGTPARIPNPLDRLVEVVVGPLRVYRTSN